MQTFEALPRDAGPELPGVSVLTSVGEMRPARIGLPVGYPSVRVASAGAPSPDAREARTRWRVQLLDADAALGEGLTSEERKLACRALPAPAAALSKGPWEPEPSPPLPGHLGYLVVEGFLVRRVRVREGRSAELLGPGDLLRPWQEDASSFCEASWEVLEPATIVFLEPPLARQLGHWPALLANVVGRSLRRARWLAADTAVADIVGVEDRLMLLLWQLAENWGRTSPGGIRLELDLPHRVLGELIGARRPTVTSALSALQEKGRLERGDGRSWKLLGDPPC